MSSSRKIDLENRIFARAGLLGAAVDGARGELASESCDAYLQVMMSVYNAFFAEENRAFLGEEEYACLWWEFKREQACLPGIIRMPGVPFFIKDFAAELWLEEGPDRVEGSI